LRVPLRGDDGDPQVPHVAYGQFRCTLAAHVSPRWFAYWLPQAGTVGVSSQGRSWPIRSRLVRRYRRLCSLAVTGIGSRAVTAMPWRTSASDLSGLLVSRRTLRTPRSA